ncbi:hypothetical protein, partial [Frankia sp. AvcI1]
MSEILIAETLGTTRLIT